jgi:hypothetical protein
MKMIDTALPEFVACMLLDFFSGRGKTITHLTELLVDSERTRKYALLLANYEYKIKNFLEAIALGMVPSKPWDGFSQAHGGYIVVKHDGEIVCFHLYNHDEFRSYLFENTCLDTPSTTKYDYGKLYKENGDWFFKLNLQIRFLA